MTIAEFEQFLEAYERDVFTFCKHLVNGCHHTACDLYQDTALAAFEMHGRIDREQNPKAFLFAIAAGKWKNMRRKARRRQNIAPEIPLQDWIAETGTGNPTAEAAEDALMQAALYKAVAELKDKFRIPLILHYFDNCPVENIAQICNIPTGTVKSRLHKARALLKKSMTKGGFSHE